MADIKWTELNPPEKRRVYVFANGVRLKLKNVVRIEVRESGKHRVETAEGRKLFVAPGWLWVEIETDAWTC